MRHSVRILGSLIACAWASPAFAQSGAADEIQQVVVTGVTAGNSQRKLDAAYAISAASAEQMREAHPTSTADLMKIAPGVYAETTGGQTGNNIGVRGFPSAADSPYVTVQLNGSPLYPAPTISFLANATLIRIDDTIERAEILRGGPSVLLSNGQPGVTMNLIMKEGGDTTEGTLRVTAGSGKLRRYDVFYGGKLADGWYGTVGGFHRTQDGVRYPGFRANDGGSLAASLTRRLADGKLTAYARRTSDKNAFYTNIPVLLPAGGEPRSFPGTDALRWTPMSKASRRFTLPDGSSGDLADGRGAHGTVLGANLELRAGGWSINNKLSYLNASTPTSAMFGGPDAAPLEAQLDALIAAANGNPALTAAAGRPASGASARYSDGGAVAAGTQLVAVGLWHVEKRVKSVANELRLSKEVLPGQQATIGLYLARYSTDDRWNLGNSVLLDMQSRPIQVTLDNGVQATSPQGYLNGCTFCMAEQGQTRNLALYAADEWRAGNRLTLDAGLRYEWQTMHLVYRSPASVPFAGGNPLAAYNYNAAQASGPLINYDPDWTLAAFTAGALYQLRPDASVYARANSGRQFPFFDQVRGSIEGTPPAVTRIDQAELGYRTATTAYSASVGLFANRIARQFQSTATFAGVPVNSVGGALTYGMEAELAWRPFRHFQLALQGTVQHARYRDFDDAITPGVNGKAVQRQPGSQWRLSPSYVIPVGGRALRLYANYARVGARYDDQYNADWLPAYHLLDAGLRMTLASGLELHLAGRNLSRQLGLTSGHAGRNVSLPGTLPSASIGTPQFGRTAELSLLYRF